MLLYFNALLAAHNKIEKEYKDNVSNLEVNKEIKKTNDLLLINQLLKNAQKNYPDNYYNNDNIYNTIFKYYKCKDEDIKQIIKADIYKELDDKEKNKQEYKEKLNELKELNKKRNNISYDKNHIAIIIYKINEKMEDIKVFGEKFVKNNKTKYKLFINEKK